MGDTNIEWATKVVNFWVGCEKVSPACEHCYAEAWCKRAGRDFSTVTRTTDKTFNSPLKWKARERVFVCSLSDFWHPHADAWRRDAYDVIHKTRWHTYLLLTKRIERVASDKWWERQSRSNVWVGVTGENQRTLNKRFAHLSRITESAKRFVSLEPLLEPVDITHLAYDSLDWVIVGFESGPKHRPGQIEWIESIVSQCHEIGISVFVKQDNAYKPGQQGRIPDELWKIKEIPDV